MIEGQMLLDLTEPVYNYNISTRHTLIKNHKNDFSCAVRPILKSWLRSYYLTKLLLSDACPLLKNFL